ncbi:MFS transporter [Bacillus mangrovi]|uniref:MFS transporter n=1 Tax=Metabacillus mangrovi TaxID=1491830 RepID=A0A7X2V4D6_9BACI|nr:MFS transporter [Metabacillus mangrovi]MTH52918.1 MFS transporter [Metabacillus mangrovi]
MNQSPALSGLFRNRVIRALLLSGLFLQIGIWVRNFSVLLFIVEKTDGNPYAISLISVAEFAPIFVFSIIGGAFADRWKPRKTMVWCDVLSAVSVFAVLGALLFAGWQAVFFAMLISAILSQFSQPSGLKLFKVHVPGEQMQMGMSIYQTMFAVFMILGPILGTFVYQQFGIFVSIGITGIMFLLSAAVLFFLPADKETEKQEKTTIFQELASGFRYVFKNRTFVILSGNFIAAGLGVGLTQPLAIFIVTEKLGMQSSFLQWFLAVYGAAMLVGGALAFAFAKKIPPIWMLAAGMVIDAVMLSIIGFSDVLWITLAAQFFSGLAMPAINISVNTLILNNAEEAYVGRVNGIMMPMFMGSMVLMMSLAGAFKEFLSLTMVYQLSAVFFLIGIVLVIPLLASKSSKKAKPTAGEPVS